MQTDYDACLRTEAKSVITHIETIALCRGIVRHTITRTYVEGADLLKTPIVVNYGLKTNYARSCLR
jgi:hypothetical protein